MGVDANSKAGRLLTFSTFRVGAYSRWVLKRINTVFVRAGKEKTSKANSVYHD